jgi:tRNA pseudouridine32 synthase/23S rRNA pseudouridine746 synthase
MPRVVFQNEWLLAIDKPSGMSYHSEFEDGVLRTIRKMQAEGTIPYDGELHSVHRLDRVTSGLLLFAKSKDSAVMLSQAFEERSIQKFYVAISDAKPIKKMGTISGDMVKSRRSQWKLARTAENPAVTRFMSTPVDLCEPPPAAAAAPRRHHVFLLRPLTGRTHQLRVALRALAAPIVGDPLYHPADPALSDRSFPQPPLRKHLTCPARVLLCALAPSAQCRTLAHPAGPHRRA